MKGLTIEAKKRELKGKNNAGRLRRSGFIPANLIGEGKSQNLQVPTEVFEKMLQDGLRQSQIIELNLDDNKFEVIVKEIQREPINSRVQHIDFIRVEKGKKALLRIAVETTGSAKGIKMGGALEHFVRSLKVKAVPESFVDCIEVDISDLDINDAVYLKDLNIPDSWELLLEGNPIVMKIAPGRIASEEDEDAESKEAGETEEAEKTDKEAAST